MLENSEPEKGKELSQGKILSKSLSNGKNQTTNRYGYTYRLTAPSLLSRIKVLRIDDDINKRFFSLIKKYGEKPDSAADYIIAATAWSKKLPLLTRNRKHFAHIQEITLSPSYDIE